MRFSSHVISMKNLLLVLGAFCLYLPGSAAVSTHETLCAEACQKCFAGIRFNDTAPEYSEAQHSCRSRLFLSSAYLCADLNCAPGTSVLAMQKHNVTCQETFRVVLPPISQLSNWTDEAVARVRRIGKTDIFTPEDPASELLLPSPAYFTAWFETLDAWDHTQRWTILYAHAAAAFWALVIAVGFLNKMWLLVRSYFAARKFLYFPATTTGPAAWVKRKLILPATFGYRCAQSVWWSTIPPRIQTMTIALFLLTNIFFNCVGFKLMEDNLYFGSATDQILRYISDRTGTISFINFPLIWLFGMRNNFAIWLTGWDFATYNNFHRWCARIATIEALIHSVGYIVLVTRHGGAANLVDYFLQWYWNAGVMATIFMSLLLPLSIYWLRRRHYETFLIIHIVFSIITLATMLGHVSIFLGEYDSLFWIPAIIWILDRVFRTLRILDFGRWSYGISCKAIYHSSANVVHLSIPVHGKAIRPPLPGTYYYVMVLDDAHCWQSHPFTVASISGTATTSLSSDERAVLLQTDTDRRSMELNEDMTPEAKVDIQEMTFIIRPYDGFTSRLRDMAIQSTPLRIFAEGPYGHSRPLHMYSHILFITGGTGVVGAVSYLPTLLEDHGRLKSIELHWAVRESALVEAVTDQYLEDALNTAQFSMELYTSQRAGTVSFQKLPSHVKHHHTRPDIRMIVSSAAATATGSSMAVLACGPEGMLDDARLAVVDALETSNCSIDYFQENFAW